MQVKQSYRIALLFSVLAITTAVILVVASPSWLNWSFSVFWLGTGIFGIYVAMRSFK